MKSRLLPSLLGGLLLSGCTLLKTPEQHLKPVELPLDPLASAQVLSNEGRWGEALTLLDNAIGQGWTGTDYLTAREQAWHEKTTREQQLQDQLLIARTHAQQTQVPILEDLMRVDPNNLGAANSLKAIRQELKANRQKLSDCGQRQLEQRPGLAQECLQLALTLETTNQDQLLLKALTDKEKKTENIKAQKQQDQRDQERKNRVQSNLQEATVLFEKDQFTAARKLLNQVLAEEPGNHQAKKQLSQLESRLQNHLENLLKTGDKLYQEGQIEGAQNIWEAALRLDPENELAKEKLERAQRVLENLDNLRKAEEHKEGAKLSP